MKDQQEEFEFGSKVKDTMTGATGVVTGRATYLFIGAQILVQPEGVDDKQAPLDSYWIAETRLTAK